MRQEITSTSFVDIDGNPEGGTTYGAGICISFQNGPLGRDGGREEPNGAFVEGVIEAAIHRLDFYQGTKFNCAENQKALDCLHEALEALDSRTRDREEREVEGTHKI